MANANQEFHQKFLCSCLYILQISECVQCFHVNLKKNYFYIQQTFKRIRKYWKAALASQEFKIVAYRIKLWRPAGIWLIFRSFFTCDSDDGWINQVVVELSFIEKISYVLSIDYTKKKSKLVPLTTRYISINRFHLSLSKLVFYISFRNW